MEKLKPLPNRGLHSNNLTKGSNKMKYTKIVWKDVNYPRGLGELASFYGYEASFTLGNIPGIFTYNVENKSLVYFHHSSNPDVTIIKRVIGIITLWIEKLPSVIKLPE